MTTPTLTSACQKILHLLVSVLVHPTNKMTKPRTDFGAKFGREFQKPSNPTGTTLNGRLVGRLGSGLLRLSFLLKHLVIRHFKRTFETRLGTRFLGFGSLDTRSGTVLSMTLSMDLACMPFFPTRASPEIGRGGSFTEQAPDLVIEVLPIE